MNIIFLEVDGVLNSQNKLIEVYKKTGKPHSGYLYPFDEKCLDNLCLLVNKTDAKLVITSTWRKDKEGIDILLNMLKKYNLDKKVIGYTPILGKDRGLEIKSFLSCLENEVNFVILDDDDDMGELYNYLIRTDMKVGLTYENVNDGIMRLNKSLVKR